MRAAKVVTRAAAVVVCALAPAAFAAACSSSGASSSSSDCPNDLPATCPPNPPSYAATVAPIFERRCLACHGEGGVESAQFNFSTYDGVQKHASPILNQVYACLMPPPDAGAPTADERHALLAWLVCHAPNN